MKAGTDSLTVKLEECPWIPLEGHEIKYRVKGTKDWKVKFAKVKKKKQTVKRAKAIMISKAQGTVTYAKSSGNKKITVNKKTGNITVKKGLKKGTYKVKIKVKAAGNKSYKAKTKTVTVKIRVK